MLIQPFLKYISLLTLLLLGSRLNINAQQVDSIAFHLYTDSLKKGTNNYINIDGLLPNGKWIPLASDAVTIKSNVGKWQGNDLVLDSNILNASVLITAYLNKKPSIKAEREIFIKKIEVIYILKTEEEIIGTKRKKQR